MWLTQSAGNAFERVTIGFGFTSDWMKKWRESFKVAEHSFQVLMPNSPLLLKYLSFGAHFLQEARLLTEVFILAF